MKLPDGRELDFTEMVNAAKAYDATPEAIAEIHSVRGERSPKDFWKWSWQHRLLVFLAQRAITFDHHGNPQLHGLLEHIVLPGENTLNKLSVSYGRLWQIDDDFQIVPLPKFRYIGDHEYVNSYTHGKASLSLTLRQSKQQLKVDCIMEITSICRMTFTREHRFQAAENTMIIELGKIPTQDVVCVTVVTERDGNLLSNEVVFSKLVSIETLEEAIQTYQRLLSKSLHMGWKLNPHIN
jgi:hypothetical protein